MLSPSWRWWDLLATIFPFWQSVHESHSSIKVSTFPPPSRRQLCGQSRLVLNVSRWLPQGLTLCLQNTRHSLLQYWTPSNLVYIIYLSSFFSGDCMYPVLWQQMHLCLTTCSSFLCFIADFSSNHNPNQMSLPTQPSLEENVGHTPYKSNAGLEPRHRGSGPHLGTTFSFLIACTNQDVICIKNYIICYTSPSIPKHSRKPVFSG